MRYRDDGNQNFGTGVSQPLDHKGSFTIHGIKGGVPFREPVKFRYPVEGAKLTNGSTPTSGSPQTMKVPGTLFHKP